MSPTDHAPETPREDADPDCGHCGRPKAEHVALEHPPSLVTYLCPRSTYTPQMDLND